MLLPNAQLIGVQKSATTSFYDWLSQHPDIHAPVAVKDLPFFAFDEFWSKGLDYYSAFFKNHTHEKVILSGNVNIIYFEHAIARMKETIPGTRLIIILRNPLDRTESAFYYMKKAKREDLGIREAIREEGKRLKSAEISTRADLTYISHGLYCKQIKTLLKYFNRKQLLILFFEDIKDSPKKAIKETFEFLGVDSTFCPEFTKKNVTGAVRYELLHTLFFGKYKLKTWFVNNVIDHFYPFEKRVELKFKIKEFNTDKQKNNRFSLENKKALLKYFINDIECLEELIGKDLSDWKKVDNNH